MKKLLKILSLCLVLSIAAVLPLSACQEDTITLKTYSEPISFHSELQATYLLDDPSNISSYAAGINELSQPQAIKLEWSGTNGECIVEISEKSDFSDAVTFSASGSSLEVFNLKSATTYFWKVSCGNTHSQAGTFQTESAAPRNLFVEGVTNVRDVGGWLTESDIRTKQGLLFRGGRLNNSYPAGYIKGGDDTGYEFEAEITESGAKVFTEVLKIKTEIDLRTRDRNGYPGTTDENEKLFSAVKGVNYVSIPMSGNADINSNKQAIQKLFEMLADENNYPMYIHCNIGTDRTGMAVYLLNALLGVAEEDLFRDYLFSNFGLIALPSPQVSDPHPKTLADLTTGKGAAARVAEYDGETLKQKAEACLKSCGVTDSQIAAIRSIFLENND